MNVFKIFQQKSRLFYIYIILLGGVSSFVYSSILVFLNNTISGESIGPYPEYDWLIFSGLIVFSFVMSKVFQNYMVNVTNEILYGLELSIVDKLRHTAFENFEKLGSQRFYTAISDTRVLARVPEGFVNAINSTVITVCGLGYLFWISPIGGVSVLTVMGILLTVYLLRNKGIERDLSEIRDLHDHYYGYLRELLYGFKEIKMSSTRNDNLFNNYIKENRQQGKALGVRASKKYVDNELVGTYSWYVVLGVIIFLLPQILSFDPVQTTTFIAVILFLMAPIARLIMFLPFYTDVKIALSRIYRIEKDLKSFTTDYIDPKSPPFITGDFHQMNFNDITYDYYNDDHKVFSLGPIDLTISKGEVIFITGGNGSGKSTFINILTGLYRPSGGSIDIDGQVLSSKDYPRYSDSMSAIFTNHYLFNENFYGFDLSKEVVVLKDYIQMMDLEEIVKVDYENNKIDSRLSKGQQKRLAMIYSLLEQKSIIVLDEWAAEQDPRFRAYFYREFVPKLKQMGKTIIAVTHDDDYYNCADRVIDFGFGKILKDRPVVKKAMLRQE